MNIIYIVYLKGANVVYQPPTFISSAIHDHQIDITIILCYIMEEQLFFL